MTVEEAVQIFNTLLFFGRCDCPKEEIEECLKMAIKALEQEPTTRNCFGCKHSKDNHNAGTEECHLCMWENQYTPKGQEPCEDAISRKEAVFALNEAQVEFDENYKGLGEAKGIIDNLPSVQPINKSVIEDIKQERYNQGFVDGYKNSYDRGHIVINDIKAEIKQTANEEADEEKWSRGLRYSLKIIDKHLAESEVKNDKEDM